MDPRAAAPANPKFVAEKPRHVSNPVEGELRASLARIEADVKRRKQERDDLETGVKNMEREAARRRARLEAVRNDIAALDSTRDGIALILQKLPEIVPSSSSASESEAEATTARARDDDDDDDVAAAETEEEEETPRGKRGDTPKKIHERMSHPNMTTREKDEMFARIFEALDGKWSAVYEVFESNRGVAVSADIPNKRRVAGQRVSYCKICSVMLKAGDAYYLPNAACGVHRMCADCVRYSNARFAPQCVCRTYLYPCAGS